MLAVQDKRVRMVAFTPQVRVIQRQVIVCMREGIWVMGGPKDQDCENSHRPNGRQGQGYGRHASRGPNPARKRIGDQPAGVRQRKLGGKDCPAIGLMRRAIDDPADGGLGEGKAKADDRPEGDQRRKALPPNIASTAGCCGPSSPVPAKRSPWGRRNLLLAACAQ